MSDEIDWTSTNRAMKEEAGRVRSGAGNPHYEMHETYRDGALRVENQAMQSEESRAADARARPKMIQSCDQELER